MHDTTSLGSITLWLEDVRMHFANAAPDLLELFETYAEEAIFGRRYISMDLAELNLGAEILEIGAGSLLLSCQLVKEGFHVTALEPINDGFSHFQRMRQLVLEKAEKGGYMPRLLNLFAENLEEKNNFDFAFSINVMEHVNSVEQVLTSVGRSLKVSANYRFTCPNYLFPYEPHFNIPTLFFKPLTEKIFHSKIFGCKTMPDPNGTWASLNWINVIQISRIVKRIPTLHVRFNRTLITSTLERIVYDTNFSNRRSPLMRTILLALVRSRLHRVFQIIPAMFHPILDCQLQKRPYHPEKT